MDKTAPIARSPERQPGQSLLKNLLEFLTHQKKPRKLGVKNSKNRKIPFLMETVPKKRSKTEGG